MSLSQFRSRGRAYQCRKCSKIDRKGRIVGHILKHHAPFDRVPFSCSLCLFRCQEKQSLVDHIKKYSRHREEEARVGTPDYAKILKKSNNPYNVEEDMVQLSKEESARWHGRNTMPENPIDDGDGLFDDEEEETVVSGGLALPRWLVGAAIPTLQKTRSTSYPLNTVMPIQSNVATASAEHLVSPMQHPSLNNASVQHPRLTYTSVQHQVASTATQPLASATNCLQMPRTTCTASMPAPVLTTAHLNQQFEHQQDAQFNTINFGDLLNASLQTLTASQSNSGEKSLLSTPCLDEHSSSILSTLFIPEAERDDPLLRGEEESDIEPPQKRHKSVEPPSQPPPEEKEIPSQSPPRKDTQSKSPPKERDSQPQPLPREQESQPQPPLWVKDIVKAIQEGTTLIANAVHSNARAIRHSETATLKVAEELGRIERKLHYMEETLQQNKGSNNKENQAPPKKTHTPHTGKKNTVKSVVTKR